MGFDPNRPYKANKVDYINIIAALILTVVVIVCAIS